MGTTLIINPGSSSKKFALFDSGRVRAVWRFERSGRGFIFTCEIGNAKQYSRDINATDYENALNLVLEQAVADGHLKTPRNIMVVGVRIVAPATYFTEHRLVGDEFVDRLAKLKNLAPHHIPASLKSIKSAQELLPQAKIVGASDSAFHKTALGLNPVAIANEDIDRWDIKHFGYHGLSASSVVRHLLSLKGNLPERVLVCHVGSGVSVTAVKTGQSIAHSMGYTPASGVLMSSRLSGVEADVLARLLQVKNIPRNDYVRYLYENGGFKGMTGVKDLRLVLDLAAKQDCDAKAALSLFARQVKNYIAQFAMLLGGVDTIVLTATAVERNPDVRNLLVGEIPLLNAFIDQEKNENLLNQEGYIHTQDSHTEILVLKTDEIQEMYRITTRLVQN